ncbi:hypothetical protein GJU43_05225 [Flavobacterium sp. LC2016-23]|uniref:hypothetical protein n=1 Tax=Flavobacterium sp. LC2016-23 TaxID=2666330 RepID=UPI0012AF7A40|nr:hypothetical protein [Flavobacterium sp. LC2016-23]MRX38666.1 hypothetical protein [Flavobacterium sp. LC2016-23]
MHAKLLRKVRYVFYLITTFIFLADLADQADYFLKLRMKKSAISAKSAGNKKAQRIKPLRLCYFVPLNLFSTKTENK